MAGLSNYIERFIKEMLQEAEDGMIEIGRNDLADQFHCAPSQINYVLSTRFTPYKGYYIESRRGGSGYIKIMKLSWEKDEGLKNLICDTIGESLTKDKAAHIVRTLLDEEIITENEGKLMLHALEDMALARVTKDRNEVRADILRNMLLVYLR